MKVRPVWLVASLVGCAEEVEGIDTGLDLPGEVARVLADGGSARLIVHLDDRSSPGLPDLEADAAERRQRLEERGDAFELLADRFELDLPDGVEVTRRYRYLPLVALQVDEAEDALDLTLRPDLLAVEGDVAHEAFLTGSLALIDQPTAASAGYLGLGTSVAVLDTGADWSRADLGSCTAVATPSTCRVAYAADFAPDDGVRDTTGHGTNVSSVVAAVAPAADILALDVFNGNLGYSSDILAAMNWVVANQATYDIAAINMSLGSGAYTSACADVFSTGVANVRAAGAAVVVASGNSGYTNAISSPACNAAAISVGAVYDSNLGAMGWSSCSDTTTAADKVTCFSNSANFLDILAPGALITAGGYTMGGTSQASPHVAGAMAVLRAADPTASLATLEQRLVGAGPTVTDHRNNLTFHRLDLPDAIGDCVTSLSTTTLSPPAAGASGSLTVTAPVGCAWTVSSDAAWLTSSASSGSGTSSFTWTAAANTGAARTGHLSVSGRTVTANQAALLGPTGTLAIAGGAAAIGTTAVTLSLSSSGASDVCVSNSTTCTSWVPYATSLSWTLATGSGTKTVYATYRDQYGNLGATTSDTIVLDTTVPTNGTLTATPGNGSVSLSWTGFSDAGSGVSSYQLVQATGTTPPANCSGSPAWSGTSTASTMTGLVNGTTYAFRLCAVDAAGNVSTGATATAKPVAETVPPTGTVVLNSGAAWTKSSTVTATLTASDSSGVTHACLSNTTTCATWFAMVPSKSWTLTTTAGSKTVYAWFKDTWGNVSAVASDTISLDSTLPTNGTVSAAPTGGQATLTWSGFSDAGSGIASYTVVQSSNGTAPGNCNGVAAWSGTGTSATLTGLTDGLTYAWRVCAVDLAGNVSLGATTTARPAPEYVAPTGSVVLNDGAAWSKSSTVTATLSASDASGVTHACLSHTTTCTTFFPIVATKSWTLNGTSGTRTAYAVYKDTWGNVSAAVSDAIQVDTVLPVNGTLSATASSGQAALSWSGFSDAASGVASYTIVQAASATAPANCNGSPVWSGTGTQATLTGLTDGTTYAWRVCAVDTAGNVSLGATASARPAPEYVGPTGTLSLNAGAEWAKSSTVTATLSASDASGVTHACLSNTTTCTTFFPIVATKSWTLSGTTGSRTAYAVYKDTWGNLSATVSDAIQVDTVVPTNGTVTATPGAGQVALTWTGFADATSGVASYVVVVGTGATAPSTCGGTPTWSGSGTTATLTGLASGTSRGFRVCAVDRAGNLSTGATVTSTPL